MKKNLTRNFWLRLLAFVLALLSWVVIRQLTNYERTLSGIKPEILLAEGWAIRDVSVGSFEASFTGAQLDVMQLNADSAKVVVDLRNLPYQDQITLKLNARNVIHPGAARVSSLKPSEIVIGLDRGGESEVPVKANTTGELPLGYEIEKVELDPESVILRGSAKRLEEFKTVQTAPIDLTGRIQSFEQRVDVLSPNPEAVDGIEPDRVMARVTLVGRKVERILEEIPIRLLVMPAAEQEGLTVVPDRVSIMIEGRPALIEALQAESVRAFLDLPPDAALPNASIKVSAKVPEGVTVIDIRPATVQVKAQPAPRPATDKPSEGTQPPPVAPSENDPEA